MIPEQHFAELVRHYHNDLRDQASRAQLARLAKATRPRGPTARRRVLAVVAWAGRFVTQRHVERPLIQVARQTRLQTDAGS